MSCAEITVFHNKFGKTMIRESLTWDQLCDKIENPEEYPDSDNLPLIKLGTFGDKRTVPGNSLRHDENMLSIWGVEGDYDAEKISVEEAAQMARDAHLRCIFYTTRSYKASAPCWRVLALFDQEQPIESREHHVGVLNSILGGCLAPESNNLSLSYYFGKVKDVEYRTIRVDGDPIEWFEDVDPAPVRATAKEKVKGPVDISKIHDGVGSFNQAALAQVDRWVKELFPQATGSDGVYRVSSKSLGRDLQEDISIHHRGIVDWGVADMGDSRQGKRTATELVAEHHFGDITRWQDAQNWLKERITFERLVKPDTLKEWVYCTSLDSFVNVNTGEEIKTKVFDKVYENYTETVNTRPNGDVYSKPTTPPVSKYLIHYAGTEVVNNRAYVPWAGRVFEWDGVRFVNTYLKDRVPKANPDWMAYDAPKAIRSHMELVFSNKAEVEVLIKWLAWVVQHPGEKIRWCPLLIGVQGDGKTVYQKILSFAMGVSNVALVGQAELNENFNGWVHGRCVRIIDELKAVGKNRHDVSEKLKGPIANDSVTVLRKGENGYMVPNTQNYIACTNHADAIIIEDSDRRWFPMQTVLSRDKLNPREFFPDGYFDEYHKALDDEQGSIRGWLLSIDTSDLNLIKPPDDNEAKLYLKAHSKSNDLTDLEEVIELGGFGFTSNVVSTSHINRRMKMDFGRNLNSSHLSKLLTELGYVKVGKPIKWNGKTERVYIKIGFNQSNESIRDELGKTVGLGDGF